MKFRPRLEPTKERALISFHVMNSVKVAVMMVVAVAIVLSVQVFLVFNQFSSDCQTQTYGHDFGGKSVGGMCEQREGKGYTVVVDQVSHLTLLSLSPDWRMCSGISGGRLDWSSDPRSPPPLDADLRPARRQQDLP